MIVFIQNGSGRSVTKKEHSVCGDSYAYHRVDIGVLIIDCFYRGSLSNHVSFGIDNRHVLCVSYQVIKETDGDLVEQDTHYKDCRRQYLIKYKQAGLAQRRLENNGNTDNDKMKYTED